MTNYISIITTAASFSLAFPESLDVIFEPVQTVGQTAKVFLSLDCFIMSFGIVNDTGTTEYFKALLTAILPIILMIIPVFFWFPLKFIPCFKITWRLLRDRIVLSIIVLMFIVHPSVTSMAVGLFNCYDLSDQLWLYKDLNVKCWDNTHKTYALGIGIPMIVIWVIGLPLTGFIVVRYYRKRLDEPGVIRKYRLLYQGYRHEAWYWEFVNIFRKVSVVFINIFLSIYPPIYKTFVATLTLAIILRQQEQIKPYKIPVMNECEFRESTTSIITLFGGMFFILSDLPEALKIILVIIIFITNVWFFTLWIHIFLRDSRWAILRFLSLFLGKITCLGKEYWKKEVVPSLKTDKGLSIMFGKDFKDDVKLTKLEEVKDGNPIIGSSSDNQKGEKDKDGTKFVEGSDELNKKETKNGDGEKKKKKKKLKKKKTDKNGTTGIENQYGEDEYAIEEPNDGNLNKTRDLDQTKDMDQTKDNLFMAGDANMQDIASDEAK